MDEIEKVQEQMKADPEALKEKMATMVEAMMSIKEMVEVSAAYQTHARAKIMGEVEKVQEQMKADMEAMKEQMATMMEAIKINKDKEWDGLGRTIWPPTKM